MRSASAVWAKGRTSARDSPGPAGVSRDAVARRSAGADGAGGARRREGEARRAGSERWGSGTGRWVARGTFTGRIASTDSTCPYKSSIEWRTGASATGCGAASSQVRQLAVRVGDLRDEPLQVTVRHHDGSSGQGPDPCAWWCATVAVAWTSTTRVVPAAPPGRTDIEALRGNMHRRGVHRPAKSSRTKGTQPRHRATALRDRGKPEPVRSTPRRADQVTGALPVCPPPREPEEVAQRSRSVARSMHGSLPTGSRRGTPGYERPPSE